MTDQTGSVPPAREDIRCTFCGKTPDQVNAMISGPDGIFICDECISLSAEAMMADLNLRGLESDALNHVLQVTADVDDDDRSDSGVPVLENLPTPRELFEQLSEHVVGQEEAKRALSVAVYNHYKRVSRRLQIAVMLSLQRATSRSRPYRFGKNAAGPDACPYSQGAICHC